MLSLNLTPRMNLGEKKFVCSVNRILDVGGNSFVYVAPLGFLMQHNWGFFLKFFTKLFWQKNQQFCYK